MLMLHISPPAAEPYDLRASADSLTIGRSSRADVAIADRTLSREHARIFIASDGWFVEDLGSRNGTFVNGTRVRQIHPIAPGDVLSLGDSVVRIVEVEAKSDSDVKAAGGGRAIFRDADAVLDDSRSTSAGIDSRDEESLRRYADHLHLINDVNQDLCRSMETSEMMELVLDRIFDHLNPEQGAIFLRAPDGTFQRCASRSQAPGGEEFIFSEDLLREVAEGKKAALVQDARSDDRFVRALRFEDHGRRSLLAAPLMDSVGSLGMIALASDASLRQFTEADLELLVSLASAAALRTRNMALAREAREKAVLEEELGLARTIQLALLPKTLPEIPGYEVDAHGLPSRRVSGDFYEVVERPQEGRCIFMIVDVSGKGIGASLMAASLEALCAAPLEAGCEPAQVFDRVSDLLHRRSKPEKYATSILASLEPASGRLICANAGHPPGLVIRGSGEIDRLGATGTPLGLLPGSRFEQRTLDLAPGDLVAFYTDGITEAAPASGEEFGAERLAAFLRDHRAEDLRAISASLGETLEAFVAGAPFSDDRTWILLRRRDPRGDG